MKIINTILTAGSILFATLYTAQQISISGTVKNSPDPNVEIILPIDGKYFMGNSTEVKIQPDGKFLLTGSVTKPGLAEIRNNFNTVNLYIEPNKDYSVDFDKDISTIQNDSHRLQKLVEELDLFTEGRRLVTDDVLEIKTPQEKQEYYFNLQKEKFAKIDAAQNDKTITKETSDKLKKLVSIQTLDVLSSNYFFTFRRYYEQSPTQKDEFQQTFIPAWEDLYEKLKQIPNLAESPLLLSLMMRYEELLEIKQTGKLTLSENSANAGIRVVNASKKILSAPDLEYAWANEMSSGISFNKFEKEWLDTYAEFKKTFPNSPLLSGLKPAITKVEEYNSNQNNAKITFVEGYQKINSLKELIGKVKGKVIYIDMWATWCGPCRIELQYSKKNHQILEDLGVLPIYLSVDVDKEDALWKKMAKSLNLTGLHMRSNSTLKKEIDKIIVTGIPHYLIIDKNGNVVEWKAKRPSDQQELFDQLKKYL